MQPEVWRPIAGYEGHYEVSNLGAVKSLERLVPHGHSTRLVPTRMLRIGFGKNGYGTVRLKLRGVAETKTIHRMVAEAFVASRADGLEVLHRDGDKRNNSASNLSWGTRSNNILDQVRHGTHANAAKPRCPKGHQYTEDNTYHPRGHPEWRECRTCIQDRIARRAA